MSTVEIEITTELSKPDYDALLHAGYGEVHIWNHETGSPYALCGSTRDHKCPESADGQSIAVLAPGSKRCWCGAAICPVCKAEWDRIAGLIP
jgi:hypothetical protein